MSISEEIRQRTDIVDFIGSYVALRKKGGTYFGLCPFHGEKTPSFSVTQKKQMFYCFGCHKGGDVIRFLMEYERITYPEAIRKMAAELNIPYNENIREDRNRGEKERLLEINKSAAVYYCNVLRSERGKQGLQYLKDRGLSDQTIRTWGLGYTGTTGNVYDYLLKKGFSEDDIRLTGLVKFSERGAYDRFFNRVIFPIMDRGNHVIGFGGRVMGQGEPKYLNSPETPVFEKSKNLFGLCYAAKSRKKGLILCEGYMDTISLHQAGFDNAIASLGTSLTDDHCRIIKRYTDTVYLTYDSDKAGINAALRAIPMLKAANVDSRVLNLSPYKDPDELIKALGPEGFEERLENAENSYLWRIKAQGQGLELGDPGDFTKFTDQAADILSELKDRVERDNYIRSAARLYSIPYENLLERTEYFLEKRQQAESPVSGRTYLHKTASREGKESKGKDSSREEKYLGSLLSLIAEDQSLISKTREMLPEDVIEDPFLREILSDTLKGIKINEILDKKRTDQEAYERAAGLFSRDIGEISESSDMMKALKDMVRDLLLLDNERKIRTETDGNALNELFLKQEELLKGEV